MGCFFTVRVREGGTGGPAYHHPPPHGPPPHGPPPHGPHRW